MDVLVELYAIASVLNLFLLEDHLGLQMLSLSCGPPLKIVPRKIANLGQAFVFKSLKNLKYGLSSRTTK